ncbi:MAG: tRNA pseudouridine(38-40) synthase TruA [Lachnospiraceae bacterium]|nr:tRNA pseudouridine(38-40) synthase TruA [Lachnospiraceae bacterium]
MKRVLMCVAYDGTNYSGFQAQDNADTIEGQLNKALSALYKAPIEVIGASRTDAGVHGLCNMVVFDMPARMPAEKVSFAINPLLPEDISIVWSKEVSDDFHPRHMLTAKTYEYHIYNDEFMPPTKRLYTYKVNRPLDEKLMDQAGKILVGEHDFKSFCSVNTTATTTVRNIISVDVRREGKEVIISVCGNGFLYNMVRIIAGTLIEVGYGKRNISDVENILKACDRTKAGPTAPACGLILSKFEFLE